MGTLVWKGIVLDPGRLKYFYVHQGTTISVLRKTSESLLDLEYTAGSDSKTVANLLGLKYIGPAQDLGDGMERPQKFPSTTVTLNGLKLEKLTFDPHIIRIVLVTADQESRVVQNYGGTTIVVNEKDAGNPDFVKYLFWTAPGLIYLRPAMSQKCLPAGWTLKNFPKIVVSGRSLDLHSDSGTIWNLRNTYDRYLIRSVDYQEQFFLEIGHILGDYGIELARYNREMTLTKTSYILYRISQTPTKATHPFYSDLDNGVLSHRVPIDFEFRTTNMQMFYDFKNRFNNVDLLSNFCEFKTTDKKGSRWTAAVKWGRITEDFSHMYESDNNSNFSFQCQFQCELYFYEVYDKAYDFIQEVTMELTAADISGQGETSGN